MPNTPKIWTHHQRAKMRGLDELALSRDERAVAGAVLVERRTPAQAAAALGMSPGEVDDLVESVQTKRRLAKNEKARLDRIAWRLAGGSLRDEAAQIQKRKRMKQKRRKQAAAVS